TLIRLVSRMFDPCFRDHSLPCDSSVAERLTVDQKGDGSIPSPGTRACIQLGGVCRERNRVKRGTPFYDPEPGVTLGIPKSVVDSWAVGFEEADQCSDLDCETTKDRK